MRETKEEHVRSSSGGGGSSSGNTALVCLDADDESSLESYREGIRRLRAWCRDNGTCVDISSLCGEGREIFTTPGNGTFYMTLQYRGRTITLNIYGNNLYLVGWTGGLGGGFELMSGANSCMAPQGQTVLKFGGNYRRLYPPGYESTRLGLGALRDSFDTLYKSDGGGSYRLRKAITIMCTHFPEAARLQCVLKSMRLIFSCSFDSDWVFS